MTAIRNFPALGSFFFCQKTGVFGNRKKKSTKAFFNKIKNRFLVLDLVGNWKSWQNRVFLKIVSFFWSHFQCGKPPKNTCFFPQCATVPPVFHLENTGILEKQVFFWRHPALEMRPKKNSRFSKNSILTTFPIFARIPFESFGIGLRQMCHFF